MVIVHPCLPTFTFFMALPFCISHAFFLVSFSFCRKNSLLVFLLLINSCLFFWNHLYFIFFFFRHFKIVTRFLDCHLFSFRIFRKSFHCLLPLLISVESYVCLSIVAYLNFLFFSSSSLKMWLYVRKFFVVISNIGSFLIFLSFLLGFQWYVW